MTEQNGTTPAHGTPDPHGAQAGGPTIRVLRGNPTPEELAAALAVVRAHAAVAAGSEPPPPAGAAEWSAALRTVPRRVPAPGPDAWRTTYWPG
jgi:hypothetical protein